MSTLGETTDTKPRPHRGDDLHSEIIFRVVLVFVAGIVLALLSAALLFHVFAKFHPERTSEAAPVVTVADLPPQPRLQMNPSIELEQVRAAENLHLDRYAWTDSSHATAQIPVDRAMTLWVQTYGGPATTNAAPVPAVTELQMRQDKAKETPHAP
jgi:hypothetical protein